ncbi:MAG: hypothetical protein K5770_00520 [Lachnospiraceae bacterium]|nr:hypothetical protein [Lachnospiraceae bacterium]
MNIDLAIRIAMLAISVFLAFFTFFRAGGTFRERILWIILCVSFIISVLPLFNSFILHGHDIEGSLSRIESMAETIKLMQFPAAILPTQANGHGCLGMVYAHAFFYIPAFIKLTGASTVCAYQFGIWTIQLLAVLLMYRSMLLVRAGREAAILATAVFLLMPYRIGDLYWRAAFSESIAMSFLPLVIASIYRIYKPGGAFKNGWIFLSLGMTGIFMSHSLTFIMAVVIACVEFIICFRKDQVIQIIKAVILFLVLNAWFIVPFPRYYFSGLQTDVLKTDMAEYAADLRSMLLCHDFSDDPCVIGFLSFFIFLASLYILTGKKRGRLEVFLFANGDIGIFLATKYFPWSYVSERFDFINMFQFPFRFLLITTVVFSMLAGLFMSHDDVLVLSVCVIGILSAANEYNFMTDDVYTCESESFDYDYRIEYLPEGVTSADFAEDVPVIPANFTTLSYKKDYGYFEWEFENSDEMNDSCIDVPFISYDGYSAQLYDRNNTGIKSLDTGVGNYHWVRVLIPKDIREGIIKVRYKNTWYMNLANLISVLGVCFVIFSLSGRSFLSILPERKHSQ